MQLSKLASAINLLNKTVNAYSDDGANVEFHTNFFTVTLNDTKYTSKYLITIEDLISAIDDLVERIINKESKNDTFDVSSKHDAGSD